jgi:hypothetical protein
MRQLDAAYRRALLREGAPPALASEQTPRFFRGNPRGNPIRLVGPFVLVRDNVQLGGRHESFQDALREAHRMLADALSYVSIHDEGVNHPAAVKTLWSKRPAKRSNPTPRQGFEKGQPFEYGMVQAQRGRPPHDLRGRSAEYCRLYLAGYRAVTTPGSIHYLPPKDRKGNPTPHQGFETFHGASPDRSRRVKVPKGWPRKLWMLGSLKLLELKSGRRISGGTVCAATGNRIYIINAHYTGRLSPGERAAQIEYIAPSVSERAGPVWFHPFDKPPSVRETAHGFLTLTGKGLRLTRRGIVG